MPSWVARIVTSMREKEVSKKYDEIGGGSPIYEWTEK